MVKNDKQDKRLNEVIRVQKRHSSFVMMDKGFLENPNLSWKAKGILAYLLSKPDDWCVIVRDVINHSTDGKGAVYSGLNELKEEGHYTKVPIRDERGKIIRWESNIYECRMSQESEAATTAPPLPTFQEMDNQDMDKPYLENWERNNNYINLTENNCTKNQSSQSGKIDMTDKIEGYTAMIHENIDYNGLCISQKSEIQMVDELVAIMVDVMVVDTKTIRVDGEDKPRALVRHRLNQLNYHDVIHVLDGFKSLTSHIKNKKAYLLTMLYNSKMEMNAHYTNAVAANQWEGGGHQ
ncbi:DUF6017 domain-containing protein [Chakrabartyella piscis]|uniref:DUF6017 domain-containing protein n=1 Tax=Chakrabartyella piscis TaxID=2918914 RepID=UPI002958CDCD|nr:DUF6017 domain-containing protein [Chakrabartyella piscis]